MFTSPSRIPCPEKSSLRFVLSLIISIYVTSLVPNLNFYILEDSSKLFIILYLCLVALSSCSILLLDILFFIDSITLFDSICLNEAMLQKPTFDPNDKSSLYRSLLHFLFSDCFFLSSFVSFSLIFFASLITSSTFNVWLKSMV